MSETTDMAEAVVRNLRDNVYKTEPRWGTDAGWESTKENWMKPENVAWLRAQPQNQPSREPAS